MSREKQSMVKLVLGRVRPCGHAEWINRGGTASRTPAGELFQLFRCGATGDLAFVVTGETARRRWIHSKKGEEKRHKDDSGFLTCNGGMIVQVIEIGKLF